MAKKKRRKERKSLDNERERFREMDVKMSKEIIATIKKEEGEYRNAKMKRRNILRTYKGTTSNVLFPTLFLSLFKQF